MAVPLCQLPHIVRERAVSLCCAQAAAGSVVPRHEAAHARRLVVLPAPRAEAAQAGGDPRVAPAREGAASSDPTNGRCCPAPRPAYAGVQQQRRCKGGGVAVAEAPPACCRVSQLQRTSTVGVLGGGQLGKMLGLEAVRGLELFSCWK